MTKSLSLYTITSELESLLDNGIDDDGVMSEELGAMLSKFEDKAQSVAAYILNKEATAAAAREVLKRIDKNACADERRAETMRKFLQDSMKRTGRKEIVADDGTFKVKFYPERDASVEIFDDRQIPFAYKKIPPPQSPTPDKTAIKQAINSGIEVPGARIVKKDRLELK